VSNESWEFMIENEASLHEPRLRPDEELVAAAKNGEPITPCNFLYQSRIWVDGIDFAVTRMEVQSGKNPSFWISMQLSIT